MSTTTPTRSLTTGRVLAWLCIVAAVACVAVLVIDLDELTWTVGSLLGGAAVLPLVAAATWTRTAHRDGADLHALRLERDALTAHLGEATRELEGTTSALAREQQARVAESEAVQTAVVALSRKVQASAHRVQEEAARMAQRHSADADLLQSSMRIDHAAAQHARQAQSLVALCGRRPGQTWDDPLPLPDVVRAAAGRIAAFTRVQVSGDPGLAVTGRAVEPLVHVVAELLANATQCSPPSTDVLVSVRQVQRGAVIEIDDCGVGMDPRELDRVRAIAAGRQVVGIADLGEVPQTGLAVVGTYARLLELRVDLTESVYGGLRAVVLVPGALTEIAEPAAQVLAPSVDAAWAEPTASTGSVRSSPAAGEPVPAGPPALPQRRSRRADRTTDGVAPDAPAPERSAAVEAPAQTAAQAGAWASAFFSASAAPRPDEPDTLEDR